MGARSIYSFPENSQRPDYRKFYPYAQKGLFHANLLHTLLELFPVTDGTILDFGAIIIDSVHRIVKELGNLRTVLDAQTDKGKDTEGGRKTAVIFEHDTLFRPHRCHVHAHERDAMLNGQLKPGYSIQIH